MLQEAPALTVDGLEIPPDVYTLDGFRRWFASLGESAPRASFLAGRVYIEMTPQSYGDHEPLVFGVNTVLASLAAELDLGRYFFPPSWITQEEVGLSTEPDGFLVAWHRFETGKFQLDPEKTEARGAPTMVFEAVSKTSGKKDLVELARLYAAAGVDEYWIADAREEKVEFRILVRERGRFKPLRPVRGWIGSPVWGRSFRLMRTKDRMGFPKFVLETREPRRGT